MFRFGVLIAFIFLSINSHAHIKNKDITLQLSWFNQFQFAGYYIAKEKGFYSENGLDVQIKPFSFDLNIVDDVERNRVDFAIGREELILEKVNNNRSIVVLYSLFQTSPLVLISKENSKINSLKDLKNKKLMTTLPDIEELSLKAMLSTSNISLDEIEFLNHTHSSKDLISGKTDMITAYISKLPFELEKKGVGYNIFQAKDYGFDLYSDFLFTSEKLIKKDLHSVKAFKEASLRGWEYAYNNIEESVDLILEKYNTQNLSREELLYEAYELKKLSYYKTSRLGEIKVDKLHKIFDLYKIVGDITEDKQKENEKKWLLNLEEFYYSKIDEEIILSDKQREYLDKEENLNICVYSKDFPYGNIDSYNIYSGINADILKLISKKIDVNLNPVFTKNVSDSISMIESGECSFSFINSFNKKINRSVDYSSVYLERPYVIVTKDNEFFISDIKDVGDKEIVVKNSSKIYYFLKNNYPFLNISQVNSINEGLMAVETNNAFAYIDLPESIEYNLKSNSLLDLKISGQLNKNFSMMFVYNKNDLVLHDILEEAIKNISNEQLQDILDRWTFIKIEKEINYELVWKIIAVFFSLLLFLVIFFIKQNKLKKEITELNRTLEQRVREEVEKNREKDTALFQQSRFASMGEMIGNIAHQWRQPLNRINLNLSVISEITNENNFDKNVIDDKIKSAKKNISYMSETIEDFINFFNPDKKKTDFLIINTVRRSLKLLESRFCDIKVEIPENRDITIQGFENEFLQVLLVILNNAVDNFDLSESIDKKITIFLVEETDNIKLLIRDNGGGIKPEHINKVFEPYFTTKFKNEGAGIGLYMAKMIIEKSMNGKLSVFSKNRNTTFTIALPKHKELS